MKIVAWTPETPNLQEGFVRLRSLVHPRYNPADPQDAHLDFAVWRWLERHPLADQMYRWALATDEGEVVGHLAATPQYYRIMGRRVIAHTPADYMVLPRYGFHALSLMRAFFRACDNCVACDQVPEAIHVEKRFGAEEVGKLQYAAKILDLSKLPKLPSAVPASVPRLLNRGLRLIDKALISSFGGDLQVEVLERFDDSFGEFFEEIAAIIPCVPEKDAAFLRWRYGPDSPQAPVTILSIRSKERLLGYAVLRVTSKSPRYGYILDLTTLPRRHDVAGGLLRAAVNYFARLDIYAIRSQFLESPTSPLSKDLRRLGFYSEKNPNTLLVKLSEPVLHETARNLANWSYSAGDGEATFWVR